MRELASWPRCWGAADDAAGGCRRDRAREAMLAACGPGSLRGARAGTTRSWTSRQPARSDADHARIELPRPRAAARWRADPAHLTPYAGHRATTSSTTSRRLLARTRSGHRHILVEDGLRPRGFTSSPRSALGSAAVREVGVRRELHALSGAACATAPTPGRRAHMIPGAATSAGGPSLMTQFCPEDL